MAYRTNYTIEDLGYSRSLTKTPLFDPIEELYTPFNTTVDNIFTDGVPANVIVSGELGANMSMVAGYLQSSNFLSGVNGWKFDGVGNLEANTGVFRGSIYAATGLIGGWVLDTNGLYYNGLGTPNIRTGATVGAGSNGVILDKDGIRGYDSTLGLVFSLYSNGSAPHFAYGQITQSTFEINTNAVLRTSESVGDGGDNSAGVLINNAGVYGCANNQLLEEANVRIPVSGDPYFAGTINASQVLSSDILSSTIQGAIITGGLLRTAESGQRTEVDANGIALMNGNTGATYGDSTYKYGDATRYYGTGILAYLNNSTKKLPFYVQAEQAVGDIHLPNRSSAPTGKAEIGDLCIVDSKFMICTSAGTPGNWEIVGTQTA